MEIAPALGAGRCGGDFDWGRQGCLAAAGYVLVGLCQPWMLRCFARAMASSLSATSRVTTEPAPTVLPWPSFTGATRAVLEPTNTLFSISVWYLFTPS